MREKEFIGNYYRYLCGKKSAFREVVDWLDSQTRKRFGKEWAKEHKKITRKINKSISWLPEYEEDKNINYFFTEKGMRRYEKTLFKVHKELINPKKISRKQFKLLIKKARDRLVVYNKKDNKKIGTLVYKDKYQIGIKK